MLSLVPNPSRSGWRTLAALVALLAGAAMRADPAEIAGTLPEDLLPELKAILATAMKQSPQVILKEIEIAQSEARALGIDAQRFPSVGGNVNYAANQTAISNNTSTSSRDSGLFYAFSASQPLFYWGALENQSKVAHVGVAIAEKNYNEARRTLVITLRQQYLALIAQKAFLRQGRFALKLLQADLDLAADKFARGTVSEGEVAGKRLNLEDVSLRLARSESDFMSMRRTFARLAGMGDLAEDALPAEIPKPVYSAETASRLLAALLRDGAKSTWAAEVAQLRIEEADLNYRIARVRRLPKFNAQAGYSVQNSTNASATSVSQTGVSQQSVGIVGYWNIFDSYATRGAKQDALETKRLRERELQFAVEQAMDTAQKLERELALDAREMSQAEVRRNLAAGGVDRMKEEIDRGNSPATAADGAKSSLYVAEFNHANARAKFLWHWSEFVSLAAADPIVNTSTPPNAREKRKK